MIGTSYRLGRRSPDAVDCSGLMQRVFGSAGRELPRTAKEMLASGEAINRDELQADDLVFCRWERHQLHIALRVDENTIIHASPGAGRVMMTEDWNRRLATARRVL